MIRVAPGRVYNRHDIAADVRRIWTLGNMHRVWVEACRLGAEVGVTFVLQPNRRLAGIQLQIQHPSQPTWHSLWLDRLWHSRKGFRMSWRWVQSDLRRLRDAYAERGYSQAQIKPYLRHRGEGLADLVLRVRTGPRLVIGQVRFTGNRGVSDAALRRVVQTSPGAIHNAEILARDMLLITNLYYNRGFVNARVSPAKLTLGPLKKKQHVQFVIREGRPFRVGPITLRGDVLSKAGAVLPFDPKDPGYARARQALLRRIKTRTGQVFSRGRLGNDMVALTNVFKDRGYAYASVLPITNLNLEAATIGFVLKINAGEIATVQRLEIRGNRRVPVSLIRQLMGISAGELYSHRKAVRGKNRLLGSSLFEKVNIYWKRTKADSRLVLEVVVVEN